MREKWGVAKNQFAGELNSREKILALLFVGRIRPIDTVVFLAAGAFLLRFAMVAKHTIATREHLVLSLGSLKYAK